MSDMTKREIMYYTDDELDAFARKERLEERGHENVTVAAVKQMLNPPRTAYKYIVFKVTEL